MCGGVAADRADQGPGGEFAGEGDRRSFHRVGYEQARDRRGFG